MTTLEIQKREGSDSLKDIRENGMIPAVMYGPKDEATSISISKKDFIKIFEEAGESTVIILDTPNGKKNVLIHAVQFDPVKDTPVHVDFYIVEAGKEVEVSVPINFVGVSIAVKKLGGTLVKVLHELQVKGVPAKLPHSIDVDISVLTGLDSHIINKDVSLPSGITLVDIEDETVASISVAKEEEEEEVENTDISAIEVEKKGKKDEENTEE